MKTAQFRLQPRIQAAFQNAAVAGIGAILLAMAGIALMGRRAIKRNFALEIRLFARQVMAGRTFPHVQFLFIDETGIAIMFGATVRMAGQPFQYRCHANQQQRIAAGQYDFDVDAVNHSPRIFCFPGFP